MATDPFVDEPSNTTEQGSASPEPPTSKTPTPEPRAGRSEETISTAAPDSLLERASSETLPTDSGEPAQAPRQCPVVMTQEVDKDLLRTSLPDRIVYLTDYLGFTSRDAEIINKVAPHVHGLIPELVDGIYAKLFEFDITKRVFMTRNQGFDGPLPKTLEDLTLDSPQIIFRKVFMKSWARRVLTADYQANKTWAYMDKVGLMHTGVSSFKHQRTMGVAPLNVPYRDCALMLGWVLQVLQTGILQVPDTQLSATEKVEACAAINKVIWIQNDLFARHYIDE